MIVKYIIYNGEDYGVLPNSLDVHLNLKSDEGKGYSELEVKFPFNWNLIKWKTTEICSIITEEKGKFFLFLDFKVKNVFSNKVILTSKQYVDFQPIIKL
jgi:hypothetical protein